MYESFPVLIGLCFGSAMAPVTDIQKVGRCVERLGKRNGLSRVQRTNTVGNVVSDGICLMPKASY